MTLESATAGSSFSGQIVGDEINIKVHHLLSFFGSLIY